MNRVFINLTAGLEFVPKLPAGVPWSYIRIQSTLCEAKKWDQLLQDLDYNFLMSLAQGDTVYVYDTSRRKKMARALDQGLSLVEYVLRRLWYEEDSTPRHKYHNVRTYFSGIYDALDKRTIQKLSYLKRLFNLDKGNYYKFTIIKVCEYSEWDGEMEPYRCLLRQIRDNEI